jgi:hypothetical protein
MMGDSILTLQKPGTQLKDNVIAIGITHGRGDVDGYLLTLNRDGSNDEPLTLDSAMRENMDSV